MAKKNNNKNRRNPSRSIKMHNRDEILKRVIDERSNKGRDRSSKSADIRNRVYTRGTADRRSGEVRGTQDLPESRKKTIKVKEKKEMPKLSGIFLPRTQKNSSDMIDPRQRSQRQIQNAFVILISLAIFAVIVAYGVLNTVKYMQRSVVQNDTIVYDSIESAQKCTGVVVRDEVVYTAPADGEAVFNVSDLDKVKANTRICSVQDTAVVQSMQQELDNINKQILEKQKTRETISAVADEVKQYNKQIKASTDNYAFRLTSGDISVMYSMKGDIQKLIDTRNQRLLSENSGNLSELAEQRNEQQSLINDSQNVVYTKEPGIISCYSDGLESSYTIDKMDQLTPNDINVKNSGKVIDKLVTNGEPLFKIVKSNNWYIVSYIPNSQISDWKVGDKVTIYINTQNDDTKAVEVEVASLNTAERDTLVILRSTKYLVDYINTRSVTFETNRVIKGYKIPNKAIVEETLLKVASNFVIDGKVYKKNNDNPIIEVGVETSGENAEEGITYVVFDINKVNVGDVLVLPNDTSSTFTVSDVATVKGVYVMNTGSAVFKRINLENSSSNENYTVLDPAVNHNVEIQDRIVTDTVNTQKQQQLIN